MRKSVLISGAVVAALALSACGSSSSTAKKQAINQLVASVGASPYVQVHLSASFKGPNSAKVTSVLNQLSFDVSASNPSGAPLSEAAGTANSQISVNYGSKSVVTIREVDSNLYIMLDVAALATIPGIPLPSSEVAAAQALFGGRWFELPKSEFNKLVGKSKAPKAKLAADQAAESRIIDAISKLIDTTSYKTLANGYSETGSLTSVERALAPALQGLARATTTPKPVKGTFTLKLTTSGSTATGLSISVTGPYNGKGTATGTVSATITHAANNITAPSSSTPITPSLLQGFGIKA